MQQVKRKAGNKIIRRVKERWMHNKKRTNVRKSQIRYTVREIMTQKTGIKKILKKHFKHFE